MMGMIFGIGVFVGIGTVSPKHIAREITAWLRQCCATNLNQKRFVFLRNIDVLNRLGAAGWTSGFPVLPERATSGRERSVATRANVALLALTIRDVRTLLPAPSDVPLGPRVADAH
jgi:hypothetical protein